MYKANDYTDEFYDRQDTLRFQSASEVLNLLFSYYKPKSMVDLGCGLGHWLKTASDLGVNTIFGYDGHLLDTEKLKIPSECFLRHDFETTLNSSNRYDLAISIEVGEHLPKSCSEQFIQSLCSLSDVVLFSAAVPNQGGVNHYNEAPPIFWANIFKENGYLCYDILRQKLWNNEKVNCIHAQNIFVYIKEGCGAEQIFKDFTPTQEPLLLYHPSLYEQRMNQLNDIKRKYNERKSMSQFIKNKILFKLGKQS